MNLRILEELGRQLRAVKCQLIVVDASPYFGDPTPSKALQKLSAQNGFGYIQLGDRLLAANTSGLAARWLRDGHFNETGNAIFADSMREWLTEHAWPAL